MKRTLLLLALLTGGAQTAFAQSTVAQGTSPASTTASQVYPSGYTFRQMLDALGALRGVELRGVGFDPRGYLNLNLTSDAQRDLALQRVTAAGLPVGVLAFDGVPYSGPGVGTGTTGTSTGTVTTTPNTPASSAPSTLPTAGTPLTQPHAAQLSGPRTVRAGEANTWSFTLTNRGTSAIRLEHGACDVRFEVLNPAGVVVRPDPKNTLCTLQIVVTDVAPGQTAEVQKIRWEGKDGAGQYTIRAVFSGAGTLIRAEEFKVTVQ